MTWHRTYGVTRLQWINQPVNKKTCMDLVTEIYNVILEMAPCNIRGDIDQYSGYLLHQYISSHGIGYVR